MENNKIKSNSLSRRERSLSRKLQWVMGLWKMNLPETKETLDYIRHLREKEIKEFANRVLAKHDNIQKAIASAIEETENATKNNK